jgi:hypothetical protein
MMTSQREAATPVRVASLTTLLSRSQEATAPLHTVQEIDA